MRAVQDGSGNEFVLLDELGETCLVWDPEADEERRLPVSVLEPGEQRDPAALVLAYLAARGPVAVRDLATRTTLCESDLHGLLADLRAAGLVCEAAVGGERAYDATDRGVATVE